ncbi:hypothetical protein SLNSH_19810 [Alsobacter soli]|uniref:Uncharacterized protein n=1 Tax=Alsobacter soli TaxID=2109933 RepID=A0A2T1HNQ6_9HYPH|nr:hypothetical protein [Alsobacter soli]PSC03304.1 hypothetical protein SLNSH_19810 [Alsobacter soli]
MKSAPVRDAAAGQAPYYPPMLLPRLHETLRELVEARGEFDYESETLMRAPLSPVLKAKLAKALELRRQQACQPLEQRLRELEKELRAVIRDRRWDEKAS